MYGGYVWPMDKEKVMGEGTVYQAGIQSLIFMISCLSKALGTSNKLEVSKLFNKYLVTGRVILFIINTIFLVYVT